MSLKKYDIKKDGHINVVEFKDNRLFGYVIKPNQPIEKYKAIIEADPDFAKYRTQENADAYEQKLEELKPTAEEIIQNERNRMSLEAGDFKVAISLLHFDGTNVVEVYDKNGEDTGLEPIEDAIQNAITDLPKKNQVKMSKLLEHRTEFRRLNKNVQMIASLIGMNDEQMDEFYTKAKEL